MFFIIKAEVPGTSCKYAKVCLTLKLKINLIKKQKKFFFHLNTKESRFSFNIVTTEF